MRVKTLASSCTKTDRCVLHGVSMISEKCNHHSKSFVNVELFPNFCDPMLAKLVLPSIVEIVHIICLEY